MSTLLDNVFKALANRHRRRLLVTLAERDPDSHLKVSQATRLAEEDQGQNRIEQELQHTHLPMLDEMELIDWDREEETVSPGPRFYDIRPFIRVLSENRDKLPTSWP